MYDRFEISPFETMERIDPTEEIVIGDLEDSPTVQDVPDPIGARLARDLDEIESDVVSTTLPLSAREAF
jgi:hypothetical protein